MGPELVRRSYDAMVGVVARQSTKGVLSVEGIRPGAMVTWHGSIEHGVRGAARHRETLGLGKVGQHPLINLGPVHLGVGAWWRGQRLLQHIIFLPLEAGPESGKLVWDDPLCSPGSFLLPLLGFFLLLLLN